ncbi:hypothetical protein [Kribbella speibonae]|uniref:Uncharacterized protein n=1 Tax=Kribbella speibonae TaxID=1572660 RepID=A0A4R0JBW3_9ACTN|nr:hypothetical protein [Kribbella speibonae]TCC18072.1 hypothetical protein E0H58_35190 [Kribbella speibonae]TCC42086.1 hypothetical protein E0H92_10780 [Kribbella speibonae]
MEPHVAKERIAAGYARLYGPLAVVCVVIAFQPILEGTYGTLWETAARPAGGPAALGLMMMFGLVVALAWATLRPATTAGPPVVIAIFTVLIAVMLITKPGTGSDHPGLTSFGNAGLALTLCGLGLTIGHLVQLRRV